MKQIGLFAIGMLYLFGCQSGKNSKLLTEVDSLVMKEEYDSAYQMLATFDQSEINNREEDKAHYNLLKVQTAYLVNKKLASVDSLLDDIIAYYEQNGDKEKLCDAYYYKAIGYNLIHDYHNSIILYKKAELLADVTGNKYQQYKIAEGISFVNRMNKNYDLQLKYAKKAYSIAQKMDMKNRMAYSCYIVQYAYSNLGLEDSATYYHDKIPYYIKYANKKELPVLLTTLGSYLIDKHPIKAKQYLIESLSYQELSSTYTYLAYISYDEGNTEDTYHYFMKALAVNDATPKDNIIRNLIEYDLERGKTDSISDMVTQIIAIRDSIDDKLKNDTIKDLQTRFDNEVAMREKDQTIIKWQWGLIILAVALLTSIGIYLRRRYLAKIELQKYQMQIHDYMNQIEGLEASGSDTLQKVDELNKLINDIMDKKSPRLLRGRMLYDDIKQNKKMGKWSKDEVEMFLDYYEATNYRMVQRLKKVPREDKLTSHRLFFLILQEMGKNDFEIMNIMSIGKETIRTFRHRTKPLEQ